PARGVTDGCAAIRAEPGARGQRRATRIARCVDGRPAIRAEACLRRQLGPARSTNHGRIVRRPTIDLWPRPPGRRRRSLRRSRPGSSRPVSALRLCLVEADLVALTVEDRGIPAKADIGLRRDDLAAVALHLRKSRLDRVDGDVVAYDRACRLAANPEPATELARARHIRPVVLEPLGGLELPPGDGLVEALGASRIVGRNLDVVPLTML